MSFASSHAVSVKRLALHRHEAHEACARFGRHAHAVLTFQLSGALEVEHGGALSLQGGDLHVIPPGAPHRITSSRDVEGWGAAIWPARLDAARFGPLLAPLDDVARGGLPRVSVPPSRRGFVGTLFDELASIEGRGLTVRAESLVALLLTELAEHAAPAVAASRPHSDVTAAALAFVAAHAFGPLSLTEVARGIGRNRSHVAEVVRRDTGRSVGEWIIELRLDEARRRLESTDELIDVIAERVGYADATHFARTYKRRFGLAPRAWRQTHRP